MSVTHDGTPMTDTEEAALLEQLVTAELLSRGVETVLDAWLRRGTIGKTSPAGDARTTIIGATLGMEPQDTIFGTARDLPAALTRGMHVAAVFQQALGVQGDPALGRALPGAVRDIETHVTLSDSSPAAHLVHAAGFGQAAALDARLRPQEVDGEVDRPERVALAFMGSAAQANGEVHAAFNFAAVSGARVVIVARGPLQGEVPLVDAAPAWGLHAVAVDGADGMAVRRAVATARARAVAGDGPTLIDARDGVVARRKDPTSESGAPTDMGTADARRLQMMGDWSARRGAVIEQLETDIAQAAQLALGSDAMPRETLGQHLFE